jgi:hypothetical protein
VQFSTARNVQFSAAVDISRVFPHERRSVPLVDALLLKQHDNWSIQCRFVTPETLASMHENVSDSLPAAANWHLKTQR